MPCKKQPDEGLRPPVQTLFFFLGNCQQSGWGEIEG
jgi:hypothetical protein